MTFQISCSLGPFLRPSQGWFGLNPSFSSKHSPYSNEVVAKYWWARFLFLFLNSFHSYFLFLNENDNGFNLYSLLWYSRYVIHCFYWAPPNYRFCDNFWIGMSLLGLLWCRPPTCISIYNAITVHFVIQYYCIYNVLFVVFC